VIAHVAALAIRLSCVKGLQAATDLKEVLAAMLSQCQEVSCEEGLETS